MESYVAEEDHNLEGDVINLSGDSDIVFVESDKKAEETICIVTDDEDSPSIEYVERFFNGEIVRDAEDSQESLVNLSPPLRRNAAPRLVERVIPIMSTTTRIMQDVPHPAKKKLNVSEIFYEKTGIPRLSILKEHLQQEGRLEEDCAIKIIQQGAEILRKEENLIQIEQPIIIVGDIHGQFYDLLRIFEIGGPPTEIKYLFLGDYVDRGSFSIECILYLWSLKICFPKTVFLLRGNHECRHLTGYFTFKKECEVKYSDKVYDACMDAFDCLPLAAVVNNQFFCVHGGISPGILKLKDIHQIDRFQEPPSHGSFCDLLWSDPSENFGKESSVTFFSHNDARGCSYYYSYAAIEEFLSTNKLTSVIRAHEAQSMGYRLSRFSKKGFPALITIFSAPNYLDVYENEGAVIIYKDDKLNIKQYKQTHHPYWLPNFTDVFSWSLPFVGEKITDMLLGVLKICPDDELGRDDEEGLEGEKLQEILSKKDIMRNKIRAIGRVSRNYKNLRKVNEKELELKGLTPSESSPTKVVVDQELDPKIADKRNPFLRAKMIDSVNERMPPLPSYEPVEDVIVSRGCHYRI